jgi:hypothetical protein
MDPNDVTKASTANIKKTSNLSLLRAMSLEHRADYIETPHGNLVRRYLKSSKRARKQLATASKKAQCTN